MSEVRPHRPPQYAGRAYFADGGRLRAAVESVIEDSNPVKIEGRICGLIVPYGPMMACAGVAGFAYKTLLTTQQQFARVLLLAPTPQQAAVGLVDPAAGYAVPDATLDTDSEFTDGMVSAGKLQYAADLEPAIEMLVPYVLAALGDIASVPVRVPDFLGPTPLQVLVARGACDLLICAIKADAHARLMTEHVLARFAPPPGAGLRATGLAGFFGKRIAPLTPPLGVPPHDAELQLALAATELCAGMGANAARLLALNGPYAAMVLYQTSMSATRN